MAPREPGDASNISPRPGYACDVRTDTVYVHLGVPATRARSHFHKDHGLYAECLGDLTRRIHP